ncbi:zinc-dependent peptidase [Maribacter sp. 2308TA10-17]|uniref:zinc-dependent peptidase n=1 Tax=Maribacter sp. 2308TA10-17 TaxID=3386276 RepID=UPI0039BD25A2
MQLWDVLKYLAPVYIVGHALYLVYYAIDLYQFNPFIKLKPLSQDEEDFIADNFPIYREFSPQVKAKCNERIIWFRSKKHFVFYGDIDRKEDLKLLLSATTVIMTLGLRQYRMMRSLIRIIVYPTQFYSKINRRHHLGEYNPNFKTIIFSADKIWKGFEDLMDNRNLAMHEFAHALSFEMNKNSSWQGRKFRVGLRRIKKLFAQEDFLIKLAASQYFREYGLTNIQEFFSVAVENYFETPAIFKNDFPELFDELQKMLNMDFHYNKEGRTFRTSLEN